tara:strand:+ start:128 stop:247 length:120 start_codon:yes stop_codon:yes gene_type:complete
MYEYSCEVERVVDGDQQKQLMNSEAPQEGPDGIFEEDES